MKLDNLNNLHKIYEKMTPSYKNILSKYKDYIIGYDHIAFRNLCKIDIEHNYLDKQEDLYHFPHYNSQAEWFKFKRLYPYKRLFGSYYLNVENDNRLNKYDKRLVRYIINNPQSKISYDIYQKINKKNQYLGWTLIHENKINHIALSVNKIHNLVDKLEHDGYKLNKINGSVVHTGLNGKLLQASIMSDIIDYQFPDGIYKIPGSYVEFVERIDNVDGFNNENASKIMNSTV